MNYRVWMSAGVAAAACAALLAPRPVAGQDGAGGGWTVGRTPWGHPDLQGIWNSKTTTPLERPVEYAGREFLTDAEAAELESRARQASQEGSGATLRPERAARGTAVDVAGAYNSVFSSRGTTVVRTGRTSLVIDPPDGRIPYSVTGQQRVAAELAYRRALSAADLQALTMADGPEDRPNDRCLGFTLPCTSMYCAFSRIVQSPDAVAIYYEAGHTGGAYRTIPLGERRHNPSHVRQWYGDPVGRWEGDTLVVDSTNFTDRRSVEGTSTPVGFRGAGETLRLVERFTRVAPDMILYRATIENPAMYSRPWTIELPWIQAGETDNRIFESACHEGNYGLRGILAGARAVERANDTPADAAEPPPIGREQAVGVARRQVLFEPETTLAELAADEDPPVWRVTLRGRRPGGSLFAFEEATVTVDARTGDVLDVDGG